MWNHSSWQPTRRYRIDETGIRVREGERERVFLWKDCKDYHLEDYRKDAALMMLGVVDMSAGLGKLVTVRTVQSLDVILTRHSFVLQTNKAIERAVVDAIASRLPQSPLELVGG